MVKNKSAPGLLTLMLAATVVAHAHQHAAPESGDRARQTESAAAVERNALALLAEAVEGARGLKLVENRVRVQAAAAGVLWPRDEGAARDLFAQATEGVRALLEGIDPADPQSQESYQRVRQLRSEMLHTVAQYDPKLGIEFLRATRPPPSQVYAGEPHQTDPELALEAELAARMAERDPKEAARLIEAGLRRGLTPNLLNALHHLSQKDRETASRLAADVIARLRPEDLVANYDISGIGARLVAMTGEAEPAPAGGGAATRSARQGEGAPDRITVDASSRRALIEALAAAALSRTPDNSGTTHTILGALREAMPEVERHLPARAAALRRRLADFDRAQDPRSRMWQEYQHLFQRGDADAFLEAAEAAPPEIRDELYSNAAWRAAGEDYERARLIAEKVSNPQQRAQMLAEFERQRPWRAAEKGDFGLARQLVAGQPTPELRASTLLVMARAAAGRGERKLSREFLEEARRQLGAKAENGAQFGTMLDIAGDYAAVEPGESFLMVEAAVDHLNELVAAAAVVDGFTYSTFREGEMLSQGGHVWPDLIRRAAATLAALAPHDFKRASAAARRFGRSDARVLAELHLAQAVLTNNPPGTGQGGVGYARARPVLKLNRPGWRR